VRVYQIYVLMRSIGYTPGLHTGMVEFRCGQKRGRRAMLPEISQAHGRDGEILRAYQGLR
jgi:hypothetical protein